MPDYILDQFQEQQLTYKCLNDALYDKEKCSVYFENYNSCKAFWVRTMEDVLQSYRVLINPHSLFQNRIKTERRVKGILPNLPNVEERDAIKAEYMQRFPKTSS